VSASNSIAWSLLAGALWLATSTTEVSPSIAIAGAKQRQQCARAAPEARDPDTVRAAFIYNFAARHVKWPDSAHSDKTSPFVLGVLGDVPMVNALLETCRNKKSGEHPIEVRLLNTTQAAANCHLVYVPQNREAEWPAIVAACGTRPILLVCETDSLLERGAHIGFYVEKSKVRLGANPAAAKKVGLEISSELLKLARIVESTRGDDR
jgi:hypothetical protein